MKSRRKHGCERASAWILIVTEGNRHISSQGVGYINAGHLSLGAYSGWGKLRTRHIQRNCRIFIQLWHVGVMNPTRISIMARCRWRLRPSIQIPKNEFDAQKALKETVNAMPRAWKPRKRRLSCRTMCGQRTMRCKRVLTTGKSRRQRLSDRTVLCDGSNLRTDGMAVNSQAVNVPVRGCAWNGVSNAIWRGN